MLLHVDIDERNFKELKKLFIAQGQIEEFDAKLKEVADKENFDITSVQEINLAYKMFKQNTDWRKKQCEYDIIKTSVKASGLCPDDTNAKAARKSSWGSTRK